MAHERSFGWRSGKGNSYQPGLPVGSYVVTAKYGGMTVQKDIVIGRGPNPLEIVIQ